VRDFGLGIAVATLRTTALIDKRLRQFARIEPCSAQEHANGTAKPIGHELNLEAVNAS